MARTFNSGGDNDEHIVLSPGAAASLTLGNVTTVAVLRRSSHSGFDSVLIAHDSGGAVEFRPLLLRATNPSMDSGAGDSFASFEVLTTDNWVLVAGGKTSGTTTPRFHKYVYGTNAWTHGDGGNTVANGTAIGGSGSLQIGALQGAFDEFNGDIAVIAQFPGNLTDAQVESLPHSLQAWFSLNPHCMWVLDQSFLTVGSSFPTASGAVTSNSAGNATTYNAPIPDSLATGDRVVIGVVKDGTGTLTWPGSPAWSTLTNGAQTSDSHHMEIRYRDVDGTEGWSGTGNTIAITGASEGYASYAVKIAAGTFDAATAPASDGAFTSANSASPDPPSVNPSWGSANTLWIVLYGWDGNSAHSAYPANYTSNQATDRWANNGGSGIAGATREATAVPENPGTATIGTAEEWAAFTVGIKPILTTHVVNDLTGGGANQTGITGTSVATESAPIGYGFDVAVPHGHVVSGNAFTETPTDTEGLSDTRAFDHGKGFTDSEDLTDTRAFDQDKTLAVEALGLTDTVARELGHPEADTLGLTDTLTAVLSRDVIITDTLGLTDAIQTETSKAVAPADTLGLTDTVAIVGDFQRTLTDDLGLTDTLNISGDRTLDVSDNLGLTDTAAIVADFQRTATENLGLTDSLSIDVGKLVQVDDTLGLTDTRALVVDANREPAETVGLTDTLTFELQMVLADTAALTDTAALVATYARTITDTLGMVDERTGGVGLPDTNPLLFVSSESSSLVVSQEATTIVSQEAAQSFVSQEG